VLLQGMAGFDAKDSTSIDEPVPDYSASLNGSLQGLRIGLPKEYFGAGLDPRIAELVQASVKELEKLGAVVKEISLPNMQHAIPAYYVIAPAEASSNLSRFDGVRFGYRCEAPRTSPTCTSARAAKASASKCSAGSWSAPTPCRPATTTPTT
jgi:aspartyl-tRNA(Asn)/glutamyl-tRNA(Gln) amidotransferase subunit A